MFRMSSDSYVVCQVCHWTFEQVVTRQQAANVSDGGLEQADTLVLIAYAPVDCRYVVKDVVHDVVDLHDERGGESVDGRCAPAIPKAISSAWLGSHSKDRYRELLKLLFAGSNSSFGNAYLENRQQEPCAFAV